MTLPLPTAAGPAIWALNLGFLLPFLSPVGRFVNEPQLADLILSMNTGSPQSLNELEQARRHGKPLAWWTIEDPNSFATFLPQAALADVVFTSDEACVPRYVQALGHTRVHWLPLACAPELHRPSPLLREASEFVLSANWYTNEARLESVRRVVDPLLEDGHSLTLYSYDHPSFRWPAPYQTAWRGATSYLTTSEQYRSGRVVLGLNGQRSGLDGHAHTVMTSMRTFEALACGKPLLTSESDAYARLGFVNHEHLIWSANPAQTRAAAARLLGQEGEQIARQGRAFVLNRHTYAHRLDTLTQAALNL